MLASWYTQESTCEKSWQQGNYNILIQYREICPDGATKYVYHVIFQSCMPSCPTGLLVLGI